MLNKTLFEDLLYLKIEFIGPSSRLSLEIYIYTEDQEPFPAKISKTTPEASSANEVGIRPLVVGSQPLSTENHFLKVKSLSCSSELISLQSHRDPEIL